MISERKFSNSFTSFWLQELPMGDHFVRWINMQYERFDAPVLSQATKTEPDRRALINETAFRLFVTQIHKGNIKKNAVKVTKFDEIAQEAQKYITRFSLNPSMELEPIQQSEKGETIGIARKLVAYFEKYEQGQKITTWPEFPGCGIIRNCNGDIIAGETLVEVKAVSRHFSLLDLKQVIVYCALNQASQKYPMSKVALLNPRKGIFFRIGINELATEVSGRSAIELFSNIIDFVSSERGSK